MLGESGGNSDYWAPEGPRPNETADRAWPPASENPKEKLCGSTDTGLSRKNWAGIGAQSGYSHMQGGEPYRPLLITETKNPSVSVERGVRRMPSPDTCAALPNMNARSPSA